MLGEKTLTTLSGSVQRQLTRQNILAGQRVSRKAKQTVLREAHLRKTSEQMFNSLIITNAKKSRKSSKKSERKNEHTRKIGKTKKRTLETYKSKTK